MKKIGLLLFVSIFVMLGMIGKVQAAEKILEVNLYEYENYDEMSELECDAMEVVPAGVDGFSSNCTNVDNLFICNDYYNNVLYNTSTYNTDTDEFVNHFVLDSFTEDDDLEYSLTAEDKYYYSVLSYYDKIIVHFSNVPGPKEVKIKNIELVERVGMAVINSPATIDGLNINVDVKFKDVNDRVVYKALVKNDSDKDYYLTKGNINSTDEYIKYVFEYDGDEEIIKAGEQKVVTITLLYNKEVPATVLASGKYEATQSLGITLSTEKQEIVGNPKTADGIVKAVMVLAISVALLILMVKVRIVRKAMMVVLALIMIMPVITKALEKLNININTSVEVTKNPSFAFFKDGSKTPVYYEYEEGMTWEEWYDSEYNVDDIRISNFRSTEYDACIVQHPEYNPLKSASKTASLISCEEYHGDTDADDLIANVNSMNYYGASAGDVNY